MIVPQNPLPSRITPTTVIMFTAFAIVTLMGSLATGAAGNDLAEELQRKTDNVVNDILKAMKKASAGHPRDPAHGNGGLRQPDGTADSHHDLPPRDVFFARLPAHGVPVPWHISNRAMETSHFRQEDRVYTNVFSLTPSSLQPLLQTADEALLLVYHEWDARVEDWMAYLNRSLDLPKHAVAPRTMLDAAAWTIEHVAKRQTNATQRYGWSATSSFDGVEVPWPGQEPQSEDDSDASKDDNGVAGDGEPIHRIAVDIGRFPHIMTGITLSDTPAIYFVSKGKTFSRYNGPVGGASTAPLDAFAYTNSEKSLYIHSHYALHALLSQHEEVAVIHVHDGHKPDDPSDIGSAAKAAGACIQSEAVLDSLEYMLLNTSLRSEVQEQLDMPVMLAADSLMRDAAPATWQLKRHGEPGCPEHIKTCKEVSDSSGAIGTARYPLAPADQDVQASLVVYRAKLRGTTDRLGSYDIEQLTFSLPPIRDCYTENSLMTKFDVDDENQQQGRPSANRALQSHIRARQRAFMGWAGQIADEMLDFILAAKAPLLQPLHGTTFAKEYKRRAAEDWKRPVATSAENRRTLVSEHRGAFDGLRAMLGNADSLSDSEKKQRLRSALSGAMLIAVHNSSAVGSALDPIDVPVDQDALKVLQAELGGSDANEEIPTSVEAVPPQWSKPEAPCVAYARAASVALREALSQGGTDGDWDEADVRPSYFSLDIAEATTILESVVRGAVETPAEAAELASAIAATAATAQHSSLGSSLAASCPLVAVFPRPGLAATVMVSTRGARGQDSKWRPTTSVVTFPTSVRQLTDIAASLAAARAGEQRAAPSKLDAVAATLWGAPARVPLEPVSAYALRRVRDRQKMQQSFSDRLRSLTRQVSSMQGEPTHATATTADGTPLTQYAPHVQEFTPAEVWMQHLHGTGPTAAMDSGDPESTAETLNVVYEVPGGDGGRGQDKSDGPEVVLLVHNSRTCHLGHEGEAAMKLLASYVSPRAPQLRFLTCDVAQTELHTTTPSSSTNHAEDIIRHCRLPVLLEKLPTAGMPLLLFLNRTAVVQSRGVNADSFAGIVSFAATYTQLKVPADFPTFINAAEHARQLGRGDWAAQIEERLGLQAAGQPPDLAAGLSLSQALLLEASPFVADGQKESKLRTQCRSGLNRKKKRNVSHPRRR